MEYGSMGSIKISEEVISKIANTSACEVAGVYKIVPKISNTSKNIIPNMKTAFKGIGIQIGEEDAITVLIQLAVKQGYKIPTVATDVQKNVSEAINTMTGLKVLKVHVVVINIVSEKSVATTFVEEQA